MWRRLAPRDRPDQGVRGGLKVCASKSLVYIPGRRRPSSAGHAPSKLRPLPLGCVPFTVAQVEGALTSVQKNGAFLRHGPPPARGACGRVAVGRAEALPQVHPGVVRGARAAAGL